jgi:hypothetical protein
MVRGEKHDGLIEDRRTPERRPYRADGAIDPLERVELVRRPPATRVTDAVEVSEVDEHHLGDGRRRMKPIAVAATIVASVCFSLPMKTSSSDPEAVPGQDGMLWTADGRLAIVSNSDNRVVALRSNDDWASAQLAGVATYSVQATTAAAVGDAIYVVHPHLADAEPPSIERVTLQ